MKKLILLSVVSLMWFSCQMEGENTQKSIVKDTVHSKIDAIESNNLKSDKKKDKKVKKSVIKDRNKRSKSFDSLPLNTPLSVAKDFMKAFYNVDYKRLVEISTGPMKDEIKQKFIEIEMMKKNDKDRYDEFVENIIKSAGKLYWEKPKIDGDNAEIFIT